MLKASSPNARYCYEKALAARERALKTKLPEDRIFYFEAEARWLKLAASYEFSERTNQFITSQPSPQERHPAADDQRLIEECSIYAQSLAAFETRVSADPDDNEEENASRHADRAAAALEKIAAITAKTAEGLQAKAGIVAMVIMDGHGELQERDEKFFLSFAADVRAFLQATIDERTRIALRSQARRTLRNSLTRGRQAWRESHD